jgi:hypothetical protein
MLTAFSPVEARRAGRWTDRVHVAATAHEPHTRAGVDRTLRICPESERARVFVPSTDDSSREPG